MVEEDAMQKLFPYLPSEVSRRSLLKAVIGVGAVPVVGAAFALTPANAQTKVPKSVVQYRDKPNGKQRCDNCALFQPPNACRSVKGVISPRGWCTLWVKR